MLSDSSEDADSDTSGSRGRSGGMLDMTVGGITRASRASEESGTLWALPVRGGGVLGVGTLGSRAGTDALEQR